MPRSSTRIALIALVACGPRAGDLEATSESTGPGPGSDTTSSTTTTDTTSTTTSGSEATTSGGEGSSESTGGEDTTGQPPGDCEVDETPVGAGVVQWAEIEPDAHDILGLAVTYQGVTTVGTSSEDESAAAIERFQLTGFPYWSRTWKEPGAVANEGVAAVVLPVGRVAAGVTSWKNNWGDSEQWLIAYDPFGDIEWEVSLGVGWRWVAAASPAGTIVVVSRLDDAPQTTIALVELDADGTELGRSEHHIDENDWPRDAAIGPNGEVVAVGRRSYGESFGAWMARWDPIHTLQLWQSAAGGYAVAVDSNGDILAVDGGWDNALHRLSPDGTKLWNAEVMGARDVAIDCAGRIVTAEREQVTAFTPDGSPIWTTPIDGEGARIEVGPAGDVFVTSDITINNWLGVARLSGT